MWFCMVIIAGSGWSDHSLAQECREANWGHEPTDGTGDEPPSAVEWH